MIDHAVRAALRTDIEAHLLASGSTSWKIIQERYPQVSPATFWRLVKEVKAAAEGEGGSRALATTTDSSEGRPELMEKDGQLLPLQRRTLTGEVLLAHWQRLLEDCDRLRSCALDSKGNVGRPAILAQSIKLRDKAITKAIDVSRKIYDVKVIQAFYQGLADIMVEELKAFPEVQQKILDRLAALNSGLLAAKHD